MSRKDSENLSAIDERRKAEYFATLLSSFDKASAPSLNDKASQGWAVFKRLLDCCGDAG